ncbi:DUF6491 family protein [Dyella mobilis]|uniref:DUF3617 family protein n=1 Tax=Dyella mobilis TaxID=1849582 RepID=A0ABS2KHD9_9GAMM|nr:DUF6491 family protein [Dyella mobilis]MBM7130584.1 hypothetical protein [Dyella mobilis]GLQ97211.1 hypothetical protein GCM10007863_16310 [Dyella mobilis]
MKPVISFVLFFAFAANGAAAWAQSSAPAYTPLPNNDCLRVSRINEWHVLDDKTIIVQAGPYQRYLVKLQASCQNLGIGNRGFRFIGSKADLATNPDRICGSVGEMVTAHNQPPCAIQSLSLIDQNTFNGLRSKAKYSSTRTQQQSKSP